MKRVTGTIIFTLSLALFIPAAATGQDAFALASWLDVPSNWGRGVSNGLVVATQTAEQGKLPVRFGEGLSGV
jgi:hypothetical protein